MENSMNRNESLSPNLTQLRQRLEAWRQQGPRRRRIPEHFWKEALVLAQTEGISRVSRILRLHYQRLKEHSPKALVPVTPGASLGFVEVPFPYSLAEGRECRVEMIHRTGKRMTIHLPVASDAQLLPLAEAFWNQRR
jgi:hypothetical protein